MSGESSQLTSQIRAVKKEDLGYEMADRRMNEQMDQDQAGKKIRQSNIGFLNIVKKKDIRVSNFKKQKIEYQTPEAKMLSQKPTSVCES